MASQKATPALISLATGKRQQTRQRDLMDKLLQKFAARFSRLLGSVWTFLIVLLAIFGSGAIFGFSHAWQDAVAFSISISTFLLLFFLQKSQ